MSRSSKRTLGRVYHSKRKQWAQRQPLPPPIPIARTQVPVIRLNSGASLPALGMGTWGAEHFSANQIARGVDHGIRMGYNHIDNATAYNNQEEIGHVLQDIFHDRSLEISRNDIHLTSKIWNNERNSPKHITAAIQFALKALQTDYLDMVLIHWPFANAHRPGPSPLTPEEEIIISCAFDPDEYISTWTTLNELVDAGLIRSIGVSNMTTRKLSAMIRHPLFTERKLRIPAVNQVEMHPFLQQDGLVTFCRTIGTAVTAAMPLGSPERPGRDRTESDPGVLENGVVRGIARELGCTPAQVVLAWHMQRGVACIPKATEPWMIEENLASILVELSEEHMFLMRELDVHHRFTRAQNFVWYEGQHWKELWDE